MNRVLPLLLVLTACGGGPALIGTWQFDVTIAVAGPSGTSTQTLAIPVRLVPGAKTAVGWKVGGCVLDLQVVNDTAALTVPAPTCTVTDATDLPFASQTSTVTVGDVLVPSVARFEVNHSADKPKQPNYTFQRNEDGLTMELDYRLRPKNDPVDSINGLTIAFKPNGTAFGHRVP